MDDPTADATDYYITIIEEKFAVATLETITEGEETRTEYKAVTTSANLTAAFKALNGGDFEDLFTGHATIKSGETAGTLIYVYPSNDKNIEVTIDLNDLDTLTAEVKPAA